MKRICPICNKEFEGRGDQKFCKNQHYNTCEVCSRKFPITVYQISKRTCSKECHGILAAKNHKDSIDSTKYTKICKICGKEFTTAYSFQTVCDEDHYGTCIICGSKFKYRRSSYNTKTCSKSCRNELVKQTCVDKYGISAPMQSSEIKAKSIQTCREKYGVYNPSQSEESRESRRFTMMSRYGVEYSWQNAELLEKSRQTMEYRHGSKNIFDCPDIVRKIQNTNIEKYGTSWSQQSDVVRSKIVKTNLERYGVENVFQSSEIQERIKQSNISKYGSEYATQNSTIKDKISKSLKFIYADTISDPIKRQNYLDFSMNPVSYIENHFNTRPTIHDVSEIIGDIDLSTIYNVLGPYEGLRLLSRIRSKGEDEIESYILSIDPSICILKDCRSVISPKEIDLYLPDYHLGIEFNPTYTHNFSIPSFNSEVPLHINYHKMKTDLCEERGIFLFHIFGYEWTLKQDIIKSMLANLIGKSHNRYYARTLEIDLIDYKEAREFLNQNHRQGHSSSKVRMGLRTSEGELVSLMTFNKMRSTIGATRQDTSKTWELSRFCSKLNSSVIGGASKLFNYFINNYEFDKIVSFSDRAHTRGSLYATLGFHEVSRSNPNYVWVHLSTDMYYNRVTCHKQNLRKLLKDPDINIQNQTEKQIMMEHGFVQVFDSGTIRWEYTK